MSQTDLPALLVILIMLCGIALIALLVAEEVLSTRRYRIASVRSATPVDHAVRRAAQRTKASMRHQR